MCVATGKNTDVQDVAKKEKRLSLKIVHKLSHYCNLRIYVVDVTVLGIFLLHKRQAEFEHHVHYSSEIGFFFRRIQVRWNSAQFRCQEIRQKTSDVRNQSESVAPAYSSYRRQDTCVLR